jgi:hypothetical protein
MIDTSTRKPADQAQNPIFEPHRVHRLTLPTSAASSDAPSVVQPKSIPTSGHQENYVTVSSPCSQTVVYR